ncbi:MAG: hypothetical protein WCT07_01400 [Candidatus Paceibacterota bacterium]|jgi:hypothetical protein
MNTEYISLEPKITQGLGLPPTTFSASQAVSFASSTSFIYMFLIILCVGAASFVFMRGGIYRMQASEAGIRKSNEEFKRGTLGLLGVLGLFLILYTLNKSLLSGDVGLAALKIKPATNISVSGSTVSSQPSTANPSIPTTNDDPAGWNAIKNDSVVRAQLAALPNGGITVNKSVCITPTQTSCTTVGGWPDATISMLSQLRNTCSGRIMITGGTEAGHRSHGPGLTPVDVSLNDNQLESCIRSFPKTTADSFCYKSYTKFGFTFCDEIGVRHWHVYK